MSYILPNGKKRINKNMAKHDFLSWLILRIRDRYINKYTDYSTTNGVRKKLDYFHFIFCNYGAPIFCIIVCSTNVFTMRCVPRKYR